MALIGISASIFILPYLNTLHGLPIPSFYSELGAFFLGTTTIILWSFTLDVRNIEIPKVSFLFLGLAAVILFQYIYGIIPYPEQMILAVSYLIFAALLVIVWRGLCTYFELQFLCRIFAIGLLVGGVLNTIAALIQVLSFQAMNQNYSCLS